MSNTEPSTVATGQSPAATMAAGDGYVHLQQQLAVLQQQAKTTQTTIAALEGRLANSDTEGWQGFDSPLGFAVAGTLALAVAALLSALIWWRALPELEASMARPDPEPTPHEPVVPPPAQPDPPQTQVLADSPAPARPQALDIDLDTSAFALEPAPAAAVAGVTSATAAPPNAASPVAAAPAPQEPVVRADADDPSSMFARFDPPADFDPEAAAGEVMRVRRSLAEKRQARAAQRAQEARQAEAPLRTGALEVPTEDAASANQESPLPPLAAPPDLLAPPGQSDDPWERFVAPASVTTDLTWDSPSFGKDLDAASASGSQDLLDDDPDTAAPAEIAPRASDEPELPLATEPDYAITLALAQESAALELWPEAIALAEEVLACDDTALKSAARELLERVAQWQAACAQDELDAAAQSDPSVDPES